MCSRPRFEALLSARAECQGETEQDRRQPDAALNVEAIMIAFAAAFLGLLSSMMGAVGYATERDVHQRAAFVKLHPCPATGKAKGPCLGYVVDHIKPLCAGGADHP